MARPKKMTVDYFPHDCNHGKTIFILENKFGNDGYAFWFKLLEILGRSEEHFFDCRNDNDMEFLQAKTHLSNDICIEILDLLAKLGAIDNDLWNKKIIWSDNFINRISDVYKNRRVETPIKPSFYEQKPTGGDVSTDENQQSKLKETKVNKTKVNKSKPKTNPNIKIFIDYFYKKYLEETESKYHVEGGKDGETVKRLLGTFTIDELKDLCDKFFDSTNKFILEAGYTIGVFASQVNKLKPQQTKISTQGVRNLRVLDKFIKEGKDDK